MKKINQVEDVVEIMKKVMFDPDSVTSSDKRQMKKLLESDDPSLILEAASLMGEDPAAREASNAIPCDDTRSIEEQIAGNYIELSQFVIAQMGLKNVKKLKATADKNFEIFAITPNPVQLHFKKYATKRFPEMRKKLLDAEALEADLFLEDGGEKDILEVIRLIESAEL